MISLLFLYLLIGINYQLLNLYATITILPNTSAIQPSTDNSPVFSRIKRTTNIDINPQNPQCQIGSQASHCSPPFKDIARGVSVHATSTCGEKKPQRLCRSEGTCLVCDANSTRWRFSTDHLTDRHLLDNQTCWASGLVRPGSPDNAVNLTLSLGKRFEVYYISLQPCSTGSLPDSIAIYKSSDFGRSWRPWHYFSTDCYRAFGLPTSDEHNSHITSANLQEVLCVALQPRESYYNRHNRKVRSMTSYLYKRPNASSVFISSGVPPDWVIAFSTTLGRPATRPWSPALIDWMTVTDIRISLMRFSPQMDLEYSQKRTKKHKNPVTRHISYSWDHPRTFSTLDRPRMIPYRGARSSEQNSQEFGLPPLYVNQTQELDENQRRLADVSEEPDILSETEFYAFSDIAIGGRCKCNGHASECTLGADGKLVCACEHNTEGVDCERCKSGYMDQPWERATEQSANVCKKCDCNLHSNECRFSNALYLLSNRLSGGVCENCQHNTAGRNCHQCAEGYYRDWTKPISHENVCLPCRCHPFGSVVRHDCDRRSGQCRCKQGVTGLTCDRCQDGYHQTRSPMNPCTKDFASHAVALAHTPVDIHCVSCSTNKERIKLKKFCRKDAVFEAMLKSREIHGNMARFEMHVTQVWRLNKQALKGSSGIYWPAIKNFIDSEQNNHRTYDDIIQTDHINYVPVWVRLSDLKCKCPFIELGIPYLIVTDFESFNHKNRAELLFSSKTAVLPWRAGWKRRLTRFRRRENRSACDKFREPAKLMEVYRPKPVRKASTPYKRWYNKKPNLDNALNRNQRFTYPLSLRPYSNYPFNYQRSWESAR